MTKKKVKRLKKEKKKKDFPPPGGGVKLENRVKTFSSSWRGVKRPLKVGLFGHGSLNYQSNSDLKFRFGSINKQL
jgi:hypothetical protein